MSSRVVDFRACSNAAYRKPWWSITDHISVHEEAMMGPCWRSSHRWGQGWCGWPWCSQRANLSRAHSLSPSHFFLRSRKDGRCCCCSSLMKCKFLLHLSRPLRARRCKEVASLELPSIFGSPCRRTETGLSGGRISEMSSPSVYFSSLKLQKNNTTHSWA